MRLREMSDGRRRSGYRRLGALLAWVGGAHKKQFQLHREEGLAVNCCRGRKRGIGTRTLMVVQAALSLDFLADALIWGCRVAMLAAVNDEGWRGR